MSDCPPLGSSIFEEWNKNIFSFVGYILFTLDGGFYCWIVNGGVQNIWNILIFKFIIPQINYSVLIKVLAEIYLPHEYWNMQSQTRPNMEFTIWTSENKKGCYKTCMVIYHIGDWIKAGVHLGKGSMRFGSLPFFKTDQIVPSITSNKMLVSNNSLNHKISFWKQKNKIDMIFFLCLYNRTAILWSYCLCCFITLFKVSSNLNFFLNVFKRY